MVINKTIVVMGGSFNPIHTGHIALAKKTYAKLRAFGHVIDEVWLLPSKQNPMKSTKELASFGDRMKMCEIAIDNEASWLKVHPYEQDVKELFTYFTLQSLQKKFPKYQFIWLMGSDNMAVFHDWDYGEELAKTVPIIIYERDCSSAGLLKTKTAEKYSASIYSIDQPFDKLPNWRIVTEDSISGRSTDIRSQLEYGIQPKTLNTAVYNYILNNNLYRLNVSRSK